jgi:hypothetical protein
MSRTFEQVFKSQLNCKRHKTEVTPSFSVQGVKILNANNMTFGEEIKNRHETNETFL